MSQFVITVPDPRHVPFVRELLAQLACVQVQEAPPLGTTEIAPAPAAGGEPPALVFPSWEEVQQALRTGTAD